MDEGWIKLHRCLLGKAIWKCSTPEQRNLLIIILLLANHEENQWMWKGEKYICKAGEFITSAQSLAKTSGMTRQQIRTALTKFAKLDFLTYESTNNSTKITIVNWGFYQGCNQQPNQQPNQRVTNEQPTGNQRVTTNKNEKNEKNDKKNKKLLCEEAHEIVDEFGFSSVVQPAIDKWIDYKYERKDSYVPTGLNTLLKQIQGKVNENGADYVVEAIENSIAHTWKGIIWDSIKPKSTSAGNQFLNYAMSLEGGLD